MKKIFGKLNIILFILLSFVMLFSTALSISLSASADIAEPLQNETASWYKVEADEGSVTLLLAGDLSSYQTVKRSDLSDLVDSLVDALRYPAIEQLTATETDGYGISTTAISDNLREQFQKYRDMLESKLDAEAELAKYLDGDYDVLIRYALTHYLEENEDANVDELIDYVGEIIDGIIENVLSDEDQERAKSLHADIIESLRSESVEQGGTFKVTVGDLVNSVRNLYIDGYEMYSDGALNLSSLQSFLTTLPMPADIAKLDDEDMVFDFDVEFVAKFGKVDFKFTLQFTGDCSDIRNFAKVASDIVDVKKVDGTYTVDVNIPEVFTKGLVKVANSDKVPASVRHAVFNLLDTTVGELSAEQEDVALILEYIGSEEFKDSIEEFIDLDAVKSYFEKFNINPANLTKDRVISLYYRVLNYADRVFDYIPARFNNVKVMNFYDEESATFGWDGEVTVKLRTIIEKVASKIDGKNSSLDAIVNVILSKLNGNPTATVSISVTVNVPDIYKVTYKADGEVISQGLLPAGADVNFYANLNGEYDGRAIRAWVDQDGTAYEVKTGAKTPMPAKSVVLELVTDFDVEIDASIDGTDNEYEKKYDGNAVTLTASVSGGHGYNVNDLTYQWYYKASDSDEFVLLNGATSKTYDVTKVEESGTYYCEVKNVLSDDVAIVVCSDEVTVTIIPVVDFEVEITVVGADLNDSGEYEKEYDGDSVILTANVVNGDGYDKDTAVFTYQWYKDGVEIPNATSETYEITNVADSGTYYCVVTLTGYDVEQKTSDEVTVKISAHAVDLQIEITVANAELGADGAYTAEDGDIVTLTAKVNGDYDEGALTCQWYKVVSGKLEKLDDNLTIDVTEEGTYIFEITYVLPNYEIIVQSEEVTVKFVTREIKYDVQISVAGAELKDGAYTAVDGNTVTLTAEVVNVEGYDADNVTYTYKWYKDGIEIPGETSAKLTISAVSSATYYCEVGINGYDVDAKKSNEVKVTISAKDINYEVKVTASGQTSGANDVYLKEYNDEPITLTASVLNGSGTGYDATKLTYQWYKVTSVGVYEALTNETAISLTDVADSGIYVCEVKYGTEISKYSDKVYVTITPKEVNLSVTVSVTGATLNNDTAIKEYDGNAVTLEANLNGTAVSLLEGVTYQWYKIVDGNLIRIVGETSKTYSITDVDSTGKYTCMVAFDISDNYVIAAYNEASVTVVINAKAIDFSGASWDYDAGSYYETGDVLTVVLKGVPTLPAGVELIYEGNAEIKAGTYTAKVSLSNSNYYIEGISTQFQWTIQPAKEPTPPDVGGDDKPSEGRTFEVTVEGTDIVIRVRDVNNVVPESANLVATMSSASYTDDNFSEYVADGKTASIYKVFDIKFDTWSGNGNFDVEIIDAGLAGKDMVIVHIHNGTYDALEVTVSGNSAKFNVKNFSDFAVVEQVDEVPAQSHWWLWVLIALIIILLIIVIILLVCLIRKNNEPEEEIPAEVVIINKREEVQEEEVEEVVEEQPVEEATEEVPEEVEESPVEEEVVVAAAEAVPEEETEAPDHVITDDGTRIVYDKSFQARLSQSETVMKEYYTELKNEILSYKGVHSRISWHFDSFNKGRNKCIKLQLRGKSMYMYIALPAEELEEKYHAKDVSDKVLYAEVPTMLKIRSPRSLKYAKELVAMLMEKLGVERGETPTEQYKPRYRSTNSLIDMGLIKVKVTKGFGSIKE